MRLACCPAVRFAGVVVSIIVAFGASVASAAPVTIQFWHGLGGQLGEALEEVVNRFNQSQSEYRVEAVFKGGYAEVITAAIAAYQAKSPPDIIQVYEVGTQTMMVSGAIYPVYQLFADEGIAIDWSDFIDPIRGYYERDGRLYSMPFNVSTPVFYYNKDAFRRAGLDPQQPPRTWNEVAEYSRRILQAGAARWGFTTVWPSWILLENMFAWHDQPFATQENGYKGLDVRLLINSDFGQMHVGHLAQWHSEGIYRYGGRVGDAAPLFVSGEAAMIIESSGAMGNFRRALTFDWGTAQLPHWGPPYPKTNTVLGGATLWVMKGVPREHYPGIARFLQFVARPEQQAWWHKTTGYIPTTKSAVRMLEEEGYYRQNPDQWTALSQLLGATPTPNSRGLRLGYYVQVRDIIERELENIFAGRKTVKQGLDDAVRDGNTVLREFAELYQ